MICKNKFSNLYTSYEIMGGHHIKAFFGMNVQCAMNEVLKFPGLFDINDVGEYLGSVRIIPRPKNFGKAIRGFENSYGDQYDTEKKYITPIIVPLQGIEEDIVYFFFEQHFDGHNNNPPYVKRKYKIQIGVIDASVGKALAAREAIIEFSQKVKSLIDPQDLDTLEEELIETTELASRIRNNTESVYQDVIDQNFNRDFDFIDRLTSEFKKEIKYINNRISFYARNVENSNRASRPDYAGPNTYTVIEKEFGQTVNFNFKSEYENLSPIQKLPSLPTIPIEEIQGNQISFQKTLEVKSKFLNSVPSFKTEYSKITSFDLNQSMEKRAPNYNLIFADSEDNALDQRVDLISAETSLPIYVLLGHSSGLVAGDPVVTVPNFILLSEVTDFLSADSNYLCRTSMVESENQYFILET
jgi:hypothetical protein